jgi:hypothetical protein
MWQKSRITRDNAWMSAQGMETEFSLKAGKLCCGGLADDDLGRGEIGMDALHDS